MDAHSGMQWRFGGSILGLDYRSFGLLDSS